jgi:tetratricopeptide (TPR) repeat protein
MRAVLELFVKARDLAYENKLEEALKALDASLELFITDQGLALKGSIYFLKGEEDLAWEFWELAHQRNPEIPLPERNKNN